MNGGSLFSTINISCVVLADRNTVCISILHILCLMQKKNHHPLKCPERPRGYDSQRFVFCFTMML